MWGRADSSAATDGMARTQTLIAGLVVAAALGGWLWMHRDEAHLHTGLIESFDDAEKRSSMDLRLAFSLTMVTIGGETRHAIFMHPDSSLAFERVPVPAHASFRAWVALKPEAWDKEGNGVVFRFGVSEDGAYDTLVTRHVNPVHEPGDRRWVPITVDLSAYAGRAVDLVLHTHGSPEGQPSNLAWDWALWAEPALVVSR
jgi:hypothetical protein